jgi:hypothetical protein
MGHPAAAAAARAPSAKSGIGALDLLEGCNLGSTRLLVMDNRIDPPARGYAGHAPATLRRGFFSPVP